MVVYYDCLIIRKLVSLRYNNVIVGLNDTMENLFASLNRNEPEISPSTLYALAYIMENVPFYLNIIMNSSYMGVYCLISLLCS